MSIHARRELTAAVSSRYKSASKSGKTLILNEFIESTNYNRKYAMEILDNYRLSESKASSVRLRCRKYGPDVEQSLKSVWCLAGGICPRRLIPFLPDFIEALERFDEIHLCPGVRAKLLVMSISTADRLLRHVRRLRDQGLSTTRAGALLRHEIPIRTYEDWTETKPGFLEIDLVAHCGGNAAGDFCYTLTATDICTGWTENVGLVNRSQITVQLAIEKIRRRIPFPMLGIDCDNGSEFINYLLKRYCDKHEITFTRGRPSKKNDQCFVEQKNGAVVRPLVGYCRYEGAAACEHLDKLYLVNRLCTNYFEPSMKLIGKTRVGARVKKSYDKAQTPWQRLEVANVLAVTATAAMKQQFISLNPAALRRQLHDLEMGLHRFVAGNSPAASLLEASVQNVTIEGGDDEDQNA